MFETTPISVGAGALDQIAYDSNGLVPAVIQHVDTGEVLMMAWMNHEALSKSLETGRTWFWSRSRQEYWCKGETSGNRQYIREAHYDCDGDTLLFKVEQEGDGGACHVDGEYSCFHRDFSDTVA